MAEAFRYDRGFIEGIKKGHVAIVHDFLDHGADVAARQVASARADIAELLTQAGGEE